MPHELDDAELLSERNRNLFAEVTGFRIEFFERSDNSLALRFVDRGGRQVAHFPWWDDVGRDLRTWSLADIPQGSALSPDEDLDQCWRILIWTDADRVYVAESEGEMNFHGLYWIPAVDYRNAWADALARFQPGFQD